MVMLPQIVLPISFYLLVDDLGSPNSAVSTERSLAAGFRPGIYEPLKQIWAQAGIQLELGVIDVMEVPHDVLQGFCQSTDEADLYPFMNAVINLPRSGGSKINGFYVRDMLPLNGYAVRAARAFFVKDTPSLADITGAIHSYRQLGYRVSGHEIGHVLGLEHYREPVCYDRSRLMFQGTTGTNISSGEIAAARTNAEAILPTP